MNASAPVLLLPSSEDEGLAALARALETHRSSLQAFLRRRLRNESDVADALQETALRLVKYHADHAIETPERLLYHVAENVAIDFSRRDRTHHVGAHCSLDDVLLVSSEPSPEQLASAEQDLERLIDGLERLSEKCRDVFLLSRLEGLSYPQIAERCGISVKMVEKYMGRALAELRSQVGGRPGATL